MSWNHTYHSEINLHVEGRIMPEDALRQQRTAKALLQRLYQQPGVILADEVGMGKTFVALAVATSVALGDSAQRPVVVMIPPSLKEKWPRDFEVFNNKCFRSNISLRYGRAENALDLLKLLDEEPTRRSHIIFLTHGALHRGLSDGLAKLAFIQRALFRRHNCDDIYQALSRYVGKIIYKQFLEKPFPDVWKQLLNSPPAKWKKILVRNGAWEKDKDDPVPVALLDSMDRLGSKEFNGLFEILRELLPRRDSAHVDKHIAEVRKAVNAEIRQLWKSCMRNLNQSLPLLIMDEAHHLKNIKTQLSSLFESNEGLDDAEEVRNGALGGVFERMLFLTATPFQLGHHELCNVLRRFEGISWKTADALSRDVYKQQIEDLHVVLDSSQYAAKRFEELWSRLKTYTLVLKGNEYSDVELWWWDLNRMDQDTLSADHAALLHAYVHLNTKTKEAQEMLRRYVIRHLKPRDFKTCNGIRTKRRVRLIGAAILEDDPVIESGLRISQQAVLPFLLSARLCALNPDKRPVFAEGLASSYEAFLDTSAHRNVAPVDTDDDPDTTIDANDKRASWYRGEIESIVRTGLAERSSHPKIESTVSRVLDLWKQGEKVLVFCHYIATGKALRAEISAAISRFITKTVAKKLECQENEVEKRLDGLGTRFEVEQHVWRQQLEEIMTRLLRDYSALAMHKENLVGIIRRYLKTPSFLLRYFPLDTHQGVDNPVATAFQNQDNSGQTLEGVVRNFLNFLDKNCVEEERQRYITALQSVQPGSIRTADVLASLEPDEREQSDSTLIIPNVRLVNGRTQQKTRQTLMLTFNTPFYPDVLIASSVMAEGVDLHLACRHIIHHDLCWNPSTLEQRTGRVDRIGAKMEECGMPIRVYLPFIGETQDEKMYRVVTDREKWFNIVMGEKYPNDLMTTERLAERVALPEHIKNELTMDLSVDDSDLI